MQIACFYSLKSLSFYHWAVRGYFSDTLLVRIIMALAAQKTGKSIYELSFECSYKLVQGFMLSHFHRFLEPSLQAVEGIFQHMIDMVAMMGISPKKSQMAKLHECFA